MARVSPPYRVGQFIVDYLGLLSHPHQQTVLHQSSRNNDDINFVTKKSQLHKELKDPTPVARTLKVHIPHKITGNVTSNSLLHSPDQMTEKGARKNALSIYRNNGYS